MCTGNVEKEEELWIGDKRDKQEFQSEEVTRLFKDPFVSRNFPNKHPGS